MNQSWHAVTMEVGDEDAGLVGHLLFEQGVNGVLEEASSVAGKSRLVAYFNAERESQVELRERLQRVFAAVPTLAGAALEVVTAAAGNWRESWRQWFSPFAIVPGIAVVPSWERYAPAAGEQLITLDPGMAFGTGLHATTRLCADAIAEAVASHRPASLLDVGTGSGLLAMVAHRLRVERIAAVENDPDVLGVALENFRLNHISGIATAAALTQISGEFDLVVANILLLTLLELRGELIGRLRPGGALILSGITHDQEQQIQEGFSPPLALAATRRREEWSCMTFSRSL